MRPLENWNFRTQLVQNDIKNGKFTSGKSTLIAFGPPEFSQLGTASNGLNLSSGETSTSFNYPIPCGLVQGFNSQQQQQLVRLFEIGSTRSVVVTGRSFGSLQMNRVVYNGPNLLRFMFAYYSNVTASSLGAIDKTKIAAALETTTTELINFNSEELAPGYEDFFMNLASTLFSIPVGILFYLKDAMDRPYGMVYFENVYISSQNLSVDEASPIMMEIVSMEFERCMPVKISGNRTTS